MPSHFVDLLDITAADARALIDRAIQLKRDEKRGQRPSCSRAAAWGYCSKSPRCARA